MNNQDFIVSMNAKIDAIAAAEKVTKGALAALSRDLLKYLVQDDSNDIAMVNRLMGVLTPMNRATAVLFFTNFLPFEPIADGTFGGKLKGDKKIARYSAATATFLADEGNNIWTWAKDHVVIGKAKDYRGEITKAIQRGLNAEKGGLTQADVLNAVLEGGLDMDAIVVLLANMAQQKAA